MGSRGGIKGDLLSRETKIHIQLWDPSIHPHFKKPFVYVPGGLEMWIGLDVVGSGDGYGLVAEEKVLSPAPGLIEEWQLNWRQSK